MQGLLQQRKCLIVLDPAKLRFEVEVRDGLGRKTYLKFSEGI